MSHEIVVSGGTIVDGTGIEPLFNQSLDAQGQWTAIQAAFALHHVGHANARSKYGYPVEPTGAELIRSEAKGRKARGER